MPSQKSVEKWKSKKWFNIYTPKLLGDKIIGEMPALDEKAVIGRLIKVSLSWVTQNPSHSFMNVGLRVGSAEGNAAHTNIDFLESNYSYLHSLVRRHSAAIYTFDSLADKNGKPFVMKLLVVTSSKVESPKKTGIRKTLSEFLKAKAASVSIEELLGEVMEGKLQAECTSKIAKIARIGKLEVRKLELASANVS